MEAIWAVSESILGNNPRIYPDESFKIVTFSGMV